MKLEVLTFYHICKQGQDELIHRRLVSTQGYVLAHCNSEGPGFLPVSVGEFLIFLIPKKDEFKLTVR